MAMKCCLNSDIAGMWDVALTTDLAPLPYILFGATYRPHD